MSQEQLIKKYVEEIDQGTHEGVFYSEAEHVQWLGQLTDILTRFGENCRDHNPKPAPTVERYRVFRFAGSFDADEVFKHRKESIGEVVATHEQGVGVTVKFLDNPVPCLCTNEFFDALVDMMLKAGAWEKRQ